MPLYVSIYLPKTGLGSWSPNDHRHTSLARERQVQIFKFFTHSSPATVYPLGTTDRPTVGERQYDESLTVKIESPWD